jgi:hypothetical protein
MNELTKVPVAVWIMFGIVIFGFLAVVFAAWRRQYRRAKEDLEACLQSFFEDKDTKS